MCDIDGVYRRLSTAKNTSKQLCPGIFCGTSFYKRQEKKIPGEKDDPSLAIGKNYINKKFLFF